MPHDTGCSHYLLSLNDFAQVTDEVASEGTCLVKVVLQIDSFLFGDRVTGASRSMTFAKASSIG